MMRNSWIKMIAALGISFMLGGCWDRVEMNDLALVMATAIDAGKNGKIKVTKQIAIPQSMSSQVGQGAGSSGGGGGGGRGGKTFMVISAEGKDIEDAKQNIQLMLSRRMFDAHRKVIIIGEDMAKNGIQQILDGLTRDPGNRLRTFILLSRSGEAADILRINYPLEMFPAEAIREMEAAESGLSLTLRDYLIMSESGSDTVMGVIVPRKLDQSGKKTSFELEGAGIFHDQKLVDYFNNEETRLLKAVLGKYQHGFMTVNVPGLPGMFSMEMLKFQSKKNVRYDGKKMHIDLQVYADGNIIENNTPLDLRKPHAVEKIERAIESVIKVRLKQMIEHAQRDQTDVLGFGNEIHRTYPQLWKTMKKDWSHQGFPQLDVQIHVRAKIWRIGMSSQLGQMNQRKEGKRQ